MPKDFWDLPLSTESPVAGEQYVLAVEKLLSANVGAEDALGRAIAADPDFALAHAARARTLQLRGALPEARVAAARAVELSPSTTRRERGHIEAIALNVGADMPRAFAHVLAHVCYEGNASEEGTAFLRSWLAGYDKAAQLHCHLSWHLALFELALGRPENAWTLYDEDIRPANSFGSPLITLSDSVSLLW